ncbi:MAG: DUF433 domain-containing protein [Armatimonadota bacterium]
MIAETTIIGKGIYGPTQVAKLVNLKLGTDFNVRHFRRWARGYNRAGTEYGPIIIPDLADDRNRVTFVEFIELLFVAFFRKHRIRSEVIHAAAREGARLFDTPHPFAVTRFRTDGRSIFAELERTRAHALDLPRDLLVEDLPRAQMVFPDLVEPYFKDIDWGDVEAEAYWPCGHDGRIVLDPARSFGQPIDHDTGVPTEALYSFVEAGDHPRMIADWYEVPLAAVEAAVRFERSLRSA